MMRDCNDCRYELRGERHPQHRCLNGYGEAQTADKVRKGLIGRCDEWKHVAKQVDDGVSRTEAVDRLRESARNEQTSIALNNLLKLKEAECEKLQSDLHKERIVSDNLGKICDSQAEKIVSLEEEIRNLKGTK